MSEHVLSEQLAALRAWQSKQRKAISALYPWLKEQKLLTSDLKAGLIRAKQALSREDITVAVVGEFSRGKTELINSLFFSDFNHRLLPTDAGRTTMCPLEIFQDDTEPPHLALLPIETRKEESSLAAMRNLKEKWLKVPLDLSAPDELEGKLKEIAAVRKVPKGEAIEMGLYRPRQGDPGQSQVEIPRWRQAILNFRHPLLERGLRILDTPGLNALGNEPELTYELLPTAHAILFVLGADTGVTQSDKAMYTEHVMRGGDQRPAGLVVVLNKIDTLWDELRNVHQIEDSIRRIRRGTARTLNISEAQVFACSAQKALLARIRGDRHLERRSGVISLEQQIASLLADQRMVILKKEATEELLSAMNRIETILRARAKRAERQIVSLQQLSGRSESALANMMGDVKLDKRRYFHSVAALKLSRQTFRKRGESLIKTLDPESLDRNVISARKTMLGAWTTVSLKASMKALFEDIDAHMKEASQLSHDMRHSVRTIYKRFQTEHEFDLPKPPLFSTVQHQVELGLLQQEAEIYRKSPKTALTEQHFVVKKYYGTLVTRARKIFKEANKEAQAWLDSALDPLVVQASEHRQMLARQVEDLNEAVKSRATVNARLSTLNNEATHLKRQLDYLAKASETFKRPVETPKPEELKRPTKPTKPYLVSSA